VKSLRAGLLWAIAITCGATWAPLLAAEAAQTPRAPPGTSDVRGAPIWADKPAMRGAPASADKPTVPGAGAAAVLEIDGAIGPATSRYVVRGLEAAQANGDPLVILQLDTPGGLDTSMRDIIRAILASRIPVVSYVSPPGARAASAGTYILYASHIAAMAPATNLGAATPVSIGGEEPAEPQSPNPAAPQDPASSSGGGKPPQGAAPAANPAHANDHGGTAGEPRMPVPRTAMERKVINDAVAYIRGLAELRGRNADWAESAVRGAASLPSSAALQEKVIDVVARDIPDLLSQIDGREVRVGERTVKLSTRGLPVVHIAPDWRTQFLAVITNPTIAYGLMLIGIYGLLLEGYNPGVMLPGVVGSISLLLALFAFQILSVNYAGLALVALGVGLIVAEFFFPTFGSLGLGGLVAFVVGSLILFDRDVPGMSIGLSLIVSIATLGGLIVLAIAWLAARSRGHRVVTGMQGMLGEKAEVVGGFEGKGTVRYGGELWNARSSVALHPGQAVRIERVEGLTLWVEPL
jgi:membrane-bound serine protease (ClpP class)